MRGEWNQLSGYYLSKENAETALKTKKNSAWDRSLLHDGHIDKLPSYRLRSKKVNQRTNVEGRYIEAGQSFYWIEKKDN